MMFYAAMRQSDVVTPTRAAFDPQRDLTRADVLIGLDLIKIRIKAAKNMQRYDQSREVTVYMAEYLELCLVQTVKKVLQLTPTVSPVQPMFVFPGTLDPMPATSVRVQWRSAIISIGEKA